jgi:hypothetical protein
MLRAAVCLSMRLETNNPTEMTGTDVEATEEATRAAMAVVDIMKGQKEDITSQEGVNTRLEGAEVATKETEVIIRAINDS